MLKFFFWILLLANAVLLAFQQGYLEFWLPSGREPARMNNQFNADKIKLIPPNAVSAIVAPPAPPPVAEKKQVAWTCTEIGNFTADDAKRFEAKLTEAVSGIKISQRSVQDTATHMVYIAPLGSKEAAEKKANELRHLGINEFYIIQDNSDLRWGISLGIFRYEDAARTQLTSLMQKGVRSARIGERSIPVKAVAFQLHELDAATKESVTKIRADFPRQEMRECEAVQAP